MTKTVYFTQTVTYKFRVEVETDDDNEAVEKAQELLESCAPHETEEYLDDVDNAYWSVFDK